MATARCVVIEDSPQGVEAARRAEMKWIAVGPEAAGMPGDVRLRSLKGANPLLAKQLIG